MTGQQLKNSILQLAIQGKLVPQDPNDEPASKLLARIRKEKEQLVTDGKLKKKDLVTTPITDEEKPFDIPESWEWCRLGEIAFVTKLAGFEYTGYIADNLCGDEGIPLFKGKNVQDGKIVYEFEGYIPEAISDELSRSQITRPCLLTPYVGTIGNIGLHNKSGKFHLGSNVGKIEILCPDDVLGLINNYILYYLRSTIGLEQLSKQKKSTAQESISIQAIREVFIPLPPLPEQHRIVEKIEELMPLVEQYGKSQEKLEALNKSLPEALKKSILQEAIMGRLVPQDPTEEPASALLARIRKEKEQLVKDGKLKKKDLVTTPITDEEKPFDIPESWEWCRLGEIFSHNNGKQLNRADNQGEFHDYITTSNLYWDRFDLTEVRQMLFTEEELIRCTATKGDLLICEGGDVGRSAIWNYDYDICIQNHIHRARPYIPLCTRYFLYSLMHNKSIGLIGGKGIGIQGFSAKALHNTLIALPPLSEQHRIVKKIEELFDVLK